MIEIVIPARNKDLGGGLEVGRVLPHGEILHHDNLDTVQAIVPGEVNRMTAGAHRSIVKRRRI